MDDEHQAPSAPPDPEQRFADELTLLLRVPYPIVFVQTFEEPYVVEFIAQCARNQGQHALTWSRVAGLSGTSAETRTLTDALSAISTLEEPAIFTLLEPGDELTTQTVLRQMQELAELFAGRAQTLVVLGVAPTLPLELSRSATQLKAPLPSRAVLGAVLNQALPSEQYKLLPREQIVSAALGLTRSEAYRAFLRARLGFEGSGNALSFDWEGVVLEEKRRAFGQSSASVFVEANEDLDSVGGLGDLKEWLETRRSAFGQEARAYGLPIPKGLLLTGIQGCGKSLVAKAIAKHWALPLIRLDVGALFGGMVAPDAAIHRALSAAESMAPSVLWLDEIEKAFGGGGSERLLGTLLTWLQEKRSEVFFVATANEVHELPPELLRKGRFDELFFVDLPDRAARAHIFAIHLRKRGRVPGNFDLTKLAVESEHFNGAEIEEVINAALYEAFAEGREVTTDDLLEAADATVPLYSTREESIKALREWARARARHAARDQKLVDFFE